LHRIAAFAQNCYELENFFGVTPVNRLKWRSRVALMGETAGNRPFTLSTAIAQLIFPKLLGENRDHANF
jgi:hypothetical protein